MAIYPPPPYPGGYYHPSPFPYTFSSYPAPASGFSPAAVYGSSSYPSAATYPYPHPASMYTTTFPSPAGFSPNWPPPAPDPTPYTAPFPSPSPSKDDCSSFPLAVAAEDPSSKLVDAKFPPGHMLSPSEMPNPSLFVDRTCDSAPAGLPELHATKPPARRKTSMLKARTSRESRTSSLRTTWASSSTVCPPTQSSKAVTGCTPINSKPEEDDDATPLYDRDFQTEKIDSAVHPPFPNFRCQGSDLTKGNNTSGASISGVHKHTGPKILSMELAEAQFSSAATNASNFYDTGTTASLSESSLSSPSDALATAYVAPQMFDEMPTPQSGYENCCSGHQNPIQSSYVHGGNTNLREQYIDEVPQSYGFSNLINRSVSLADGTKHCYYALPEDYPLQLASPPMSTSTEGKIGVRAPFSVAAGLAPVLCSKANTDGSQPILTENQQLSMTGQDLSQIPETYPFVRATPQPVFDDYGEEIDGCSNEFVDIFAGIPDQQEYEEEQHRNSQALKRFSKPMFSSERLTVDTVVVFSLATGQKPDTELCGNHVKQQVNSRNMPITEAGRKEWDPGTVQIIMDVPAVVKWSSLEGLIHAVNLSPNILLSRTVYDATTFPNILVSVPLSVQWDPGTSAYLHSSNANLCNQVGTYEISIDLGFTVSGDTVVVDCCNLPTDTIFSTMILEVVLYYSQGHGVENRETMQWDPGVKTSSYTWLDFLTVWSKTDKSLSCTHIPDLASWPNQPVSSAICIWDPGIGISSPMYHWLPSLTAATEKPLSSLQTPEPATWLSLVNNVSYAWDPGTILSQNKSILMLLFIEEKEMVTLIIDNWEFLSHQSVKKNYTAKNLLSLQNYLQIWKMDVIFITFLPP